MLKKCPICNKMYNAGEYYCLKCRYKLIDAESPKDSTPKQINAPTCPTCGSTNLKKISDLKRASHWLAFGFASKTAQSQFECLSCGYKW